MGKIRIDRKAHKRKGYRRKGRRVKRAHVKRTVYLTRDRGKRGRTPKRKRWSRGVKFDRIPGYGIDAPSSKRLTALRRNIRAEGGGRKGKLSTARTLQGIINLNPSSKSDRIMKKDLRKIYPSWGKGRR